MTDSPSPSLVSQLFGGRDARPLMAVLGLVHGFLFYVLEQISDDIRPTPAYILGWAFFLVASFFVLHFASTGRDRIRLAALTIGAGALYGTVTYFLSAGVPAEDAAYQGEAALRAAWYTIHIPILYVLLPFVQDFQRTGRLAFDYTDLFRDSWNNFFIAALGHLYAGGFWIVLLIWGQLFDLIGVSFFEDLFEESAFAWPMTGAMLAYGVAAARESDATLSMLREIARSLFRVVYPLMAAVTIGFTGTVLVTGLSPLFEQASAAAIMASWQGFGILFLNAVYGDGREAPPYNVWVRRITEAGTLLLPVLGGIGLYAVWLRIDQYGLTPDRFFGLIGLLLLSLYVVGYAVAVVRRGKPWIPLLRPINRAMAVLVVLVGLLLQTPVLDPIAWSLDSQLSRLTSGKTLPAEFGYGYLRFRLGRKGYEALERLEAEAVEGSVAAKRINAAMLAKELSDLGPQEGLAEMAPRPIVLSDAAAAAGEALPPQLVQAFTARAADDGSLQQCGKDLVCPAFSAPVIEGGSREWVVLVDANRWPRLLVFAESSGDEKRLEYQGVFNAAETGSPTGAELIERVQAGTFELRPNRNLDLVVDGFHIRFEAESFFVR